MQLVVLFAIRKAVSAATIELIGLSLLQRFGESGETSIAPAHCETSKVMMGRGTLTRVKR